MSLDTYHVPLYIRFARWILRPTIRGLLLLLGRVEITGMANIPRDGPYLIAINHVSLFEAPFILSFWPVAPEAAGASDIWHRPGQSILVRLYAGIPVHRGEYDRKVIDKMLSALRSGRPLLIAPEGTRSHTPGMRRAHPGVAYIMDRARVPVLPVGIVGTTDDFLKRALRGERPLLEMHIGKSLELPPISGSAEKRRIARYNNADSVMAHIATLLPPEYRGVYADHPFLRTEATGGDRPA